MAPGRNPAARTREPAETPFTDYERLRAQNLMGDNQMFQRLGLSTLASWINNASSMSKDDVSQESRSLYDARDSECSEQEEVNMDSQVAKGVRKNTSNRGGNISARGPRGSKRVVATDREKAPIRVTRQRSTVTKQVPSESLTAATQDALEHPNSPLQNENQIDTGDEGALIATRKQLPMGKSLGKGLDSLSRGLGTKIPIQIFEGKRRSEPPIQAAKLASEGGIILKQHIPIYPHWKNYKKDEGQITNYIGKLAGQFTMDVNSKAVHEACTDLLKCGQRQMRYRLKKKYFDGVPANQVRTTSPIKHMTDEQWRALVEMWSNPTHKKQDKYKDTEPTAIDLFKETHCSSKIGFTESVKKAIDEMEAIVAEPEHDGQHVKSSTDVVSEVLSQSSKFLQNVGILSSSKSSTRGCVSSKVQELQAQLETEKQEKAELRQEMDSLKLQAQESELTMAKQEHEVDRLKDTIKSQAQQSEAAMAKQSEEIESLKKTVQDCSGFLRQMITF